MALFFMEESGLGFCLFVFHTPKALVKENLIILVRDFLPVYKIMDSLPA
jgi:hypothetical protein